MLNSRSLIIPVVAAVICAMSPLTATAEEVLGQGSFTGKSGHRTSGSVSIVKTQGGIEVRLGSNFKLDGAPDPWLGFGNSGKYDSAGEVAILKSNKGPQVYKVAGKIDASKYNEVYVWCRKFAVPLGVAKLK